MRAGSFPCSPALLFTQKPEQPAGGDHGAAKDRWYPAARVDRSADPPQPGPLAIRVPRAVQRPGHPEGFDRTVERPAGASPGAEVPRVQDLMFAKILRGRLRESDHTRHPVYLPR